MQRSKIKMKNLKFKSAFAQNFLPFGPEGISINFESLKNIVLIKGENTDYKDASSRESSNGSGKSSIQEIIVWTLYGKTIKSPKKLSKNDVIHNLYKKGCKTEVCFDNYKVQRGRAPDYLKLWELNGEEWKEYTQGKSQDTQARIEELIGLTYESFLSTSIFTDDQSNCFLEANASEKREIVEDLLSLTIYKQRFENSKILLKENKINLKQFISEYDILLSNSTSIENKINSHIKTETDWKKTKQQEIRKSLENIKDKESELESINEDENIKKYENAKAQSKTINEQIKNKENDLKQILEDKDKIKNKIDTISKNLNLKKDNLRNLEFDKKNKNNEIEKNNKEIKSLQNNKIGQTCKVCFNKINPENYNNVIEKYNKNNEVLQNEIENIEKQIKKLNLSEEEKSLKDNENVLKDFSKKENENNIILSKLRKDFLNLSSIKEPETNSLKKVLEKEIEIIKNQIIKMKEDYKNSPYKEIIESLQKDLNESKEKLTNKQKAIKELENQIPYYEFWTNAFGDTGIRKWIVDGIIPALNSRLDYWMQILDDNRIKIEFNNELEEKIYKNLEENIEFYYYTMSAGQKRRLNLAVNQSFAHIMMLTTNTCPSICFLDEVTTNIDPVGVQGIYNMICELSEHRQIFITTHDPDLLNMLSGCDTLELKMKNAVSKLEVKKDV